MRIAVAMIPLLLVACGESVITPTTYEAAFELCKPHGGLVWVTRDVAYSDRDKIKIVCKNNELVAFMTVERPKPATP